MKARAVLPLVLALLVCSGCQRALVRPERLDEPAMRAWIQGNYAPLNGLNQSWRAVYEGDGQRVPFRLDLDWNADSARITLFSPFGGELAVLGCSSESLKARPGSELGGWLDRAAKALDGKFLGNVLEQGARLLEGGVGPGMTVELKDPTLAPLLLVLGRRLPGKLLDGGLCQRQQAGPWLWGEWLPPPTATWEPGNLRFVQGRDLWRVNAQHGLVDFAQVGDWEMELDEFEEVEGLLLPGRLRIHERGREAGEGHRLILQNRQRRLHIQGRED